MNVGLLRSEFQQTPYHNTDPAVAGNFQDAYYAIDQNEKKLQYFTVNGSSSCINDPTFCVDSVNKYVLLSTSAKMGIGGTPSATARYLYVTSSGDTYARFNAASSANTILELTENNSTTSGQFWQIYKNNSAASPAHALIFNNGADRVAIDSSGRVGIGTISPGAGYKLDIQRNTAGDSGTVRISGDNGTADGGAGLSLAYNNTTKWSIFERNVSGHAHTLGISTSENDHAGDLIEVTTGQTLFKTNSTISTPSLSFIGDPDTGIWHSASVNDRMDFVIGGTDVYTLTATTLDSTARYQAPNGTSSNPGYTFTNNTANGMYSGGNTLGLAVPTSGDVEMRVNGTQIFDGSASAVFLLKQVRSAIGSSAGAPDYSFNGDEDSGMYRSGANLVGVASGGVLSVEIGSYVAAKRSGFATQDGSNSAPGYAFDSATNTGIYRNGSNLAFAVGGTAVYQVTASQISPNADNAIANGSGSARWTAVFAVNGTIQTSSSRLKKQIREIVVNDSTTTLVALSTMDVTEASFNAADDPTDIQVPRGIVFKWKNPASTTTANADMIGFVGDDLPQEAHAVNPDGTRDPLNFYTSAVIGIQSAAIRDLQRRVRSQNRQIKRLEAIVTAMETQLNITVTDPDPGADQ